MTMRRPQEPSASAAIVAIDPTARRADSGRSQRSQARAAQRVSLLATLIAQRVPDALAHALADDASRLGQDDLCRALASALENRMRAKPIDYVHANAILLKGMNGSGKTNVAAKIAAQAYLTGRKVTVMAADASAPRLVELTSRLKVKVVATPGAPAIARAVGQAHHRNSLLVIDTCGFNPRRAKARAAFDALGQIGRVLTIGVVSALYDAAEIGELIEALCADRTIVTGLDLARRSGALAIAATHPTPLAHVARSPFAGDGLEPLMPHTLARFLLATRAS